MEILDERNLVMLEKQTFLCHYHVSGNNFCCEITNDDCSFQTYYGIIRIKKIYLKRK